MNSIKDYIESQVRLLQQLDLAPVNELVARLERARVEGRRIFLFGNGGSMATASHFACDLGKGTIQPERPRFKVMVFDSVPTLTAYANDHGYETVFAEPLITHSQPGDVAIAFTASGHSPNIVRAIETANQHGLVTVAFTGFDGGKVKHHVELNIHVPVNSYALVEDAHLILTHAICEMLKLPHEPH